jgi:hypothetical protein
MKQALAIEVEVEAGGAGERVLSEWLRAWRRRGVRAVGKALYRHQGAFVVRRFHASAPALADLRLRMQGYCGEIELRIDPREPPDLS